MVSTLLYLAVSRGLSLGDLTLGVVGVGNVGRKVALAAEALGMRVLRNDPPRARKEGGRGFVTLHELLKRSDLVTLHVPLNRKGRDKTYRMVEGEFIRALKPSCILINTSRGEVVNEQELIRGTAQGRLGGLVLDVFEGEPRINQELLDRVTLATPHIAGYSLDGKAGGTIMSVRALSRFFHLGMDHWEPDHIPLPGETTLTGDPAAKGRQELLWELYRATYDVTLDDKRLRRQPDRFEALRGDYPPRREPHVYTVGLPAGCRGIASTLESLGFSIKNII
jgi:erythronate-4-phosphate dehydrogenase